MTSPNPMALEAKALEAARDKLWEDLRYQGTKHSRQKTDELAEQVVRAYVAALPLPAAGEGLEPVAWRWRWGKLGRNTAWHFSPEKPGPFPEEGYEIEPLYAATPAARSAVLEPSALKAIDSQVLTAARSMEKEQREQPEWVWHANDGPGRTSYGRWQKLPHQAPYIRADLVLRALKEKT